MLLSIPQSRLISTILSGVIRGSTLPFVMACRAYSLLLIPADFALFSNITSSCKLSRILIACVRFCDSSTVG
ncbi:MAG: hypothetical protein SNI70_11330 [Rikenellaceae bacterium]